MPDKVKTLLNLTGERFETAEKGLIFLDSETFFVYKNRIRCFR